MRHALVGGVEPELAARQRDVDGASLRYGEAVDDHAEGTTA